MSNQSIKITDPVSGNTYEFVPASVNQSQAIAEASQKTFDGLMGRLVSIDSLEEFQFLESLLPYTTDDATNFVKDGDFPRGRFWTANSETDALKYFTNSWDTTSLENLDSALHPDGAAHYIVEYEQIEQSNQSIKITDPVSGNTYEFVPASVNQSQAIAEASQKTFDGLMGRLVSIDSLEEFQFLESLLPYTTDDATNFVKDGDFPRGRFWTANSETDALKYFTNSWDTTSLENLDSALHPDGAAHYIVEYESDVDHESTDRPEPVVEQESNLVASLQAGSYSLTVIADVFGSIMFLDGLTETVTASYHSIEYNGTTFDYAEVDGIITTVVRDGEFTDEFAAEIAESFPDAAGISYSTAVALIGQANMGSTLLMVAGADGDYVG